MGGSDNEGDGLASQPRRYRVPGQPLLNRHQVGGVSDSPDGLFAHQEREPIGADQPRGGKGHMVDGRDNAWRNRQPQCKEQQPDGMSPYRNNNHTAHKGSNICAQKGLSSGENYYCQNKQCLNDNMADRGSAGRRAAICSFNHCVF